MNHEGLKAPLEILLKPTECLKFTKGDSGEVERFCWCNIDKRWLGSWNTFEEELHLMGNFSRESGWL